MPDWRSAKTEAEAITQAWSRERGPGGAIVMFTGEGVREVASGGFANIEHAVDFTPETVTRFASISKHFLAVMLLREGVALDAPLGDLLPDVPDAFRGVTLGRVLDMTGALPDMIETLWQLGLPYTASLSADDILRVAAKLPSLNAAPGEEMAYSNTGWRLAQRVLTMRRGIDYAECLAQLMTMLDLPIRFVEDETRIVPHLANGYWRDTEWRRGRYGLHFSASGGIAGSALALARWCGALLGGQGSLAGMLEKLLAPRHFVDGQESVYRLGLVASQLGGTTLAGHGGSLPGYRNHMLMVPVHGVGVVVLTNREEDALWPAIRVMSALIAEPLPQNAANLPVGLFASETGPFWAELSEGAIAFMGAHEQLFDDGRGGWRSLPAYLDIRLRRAATDIIEGDIGGVSRRLTRVPSDMTLDARLVGRWRNPTFGAEITIRADATANSG